LRSVDVVAASSNCAGVKLSGIFISQKLSRGGFSEAKTGGGCKLSFVVALNLVLWGSDVADLSVVVVQRAVFK